MFLYKIQVMLSAVLSNKSPNVGVHALGPLAGVKPQSQQPLEIDYAAMMIT
jgi:hypothetical protein